MFPIRDHNPSLTTPYVTRALVFANIALYLLTAPWAGGMVGLWVEWALYPIAIMQGSYLWGLLTHMFLHAGIMHIAGNMLFLWIFGDNLEDQMGHLPFLLFYLACGLLAAFAQIAVDPWSDVPMVGASGAIAGVMGGYLLLFPKARVDVLAVFIVFIRIFTIRAWIMLSVWLALQLVMGLIASGEDGVAYWAHYGGFMAGLVLALPLFLRRGGAAFWQRTSGHPPHAAIDYRQSRIPSVRR